MVAVGRGAALVTGAARRIGREICLAISRRGYPVIVHYNTSKSAAMQLMDDIIASGGKAMLYQADLKEVFDYSSCFERCSVELGEQVTCLVNSASIYEHDDIRSFNPTLFDDAMSVNVRAPLCLISAFVAQLKGRRGSVVNILDQKIENANADHLSYTLSKHALLGATKCLSRSLASSGIRVNGVAPGFVLPHSRINNEVIQTAHRHSPLGYGPTVADIADSVCYLMEAEAVTGQVLFVDAGERMNQRIRDI